MRRGTIGLCGFALAWGVLPLSARPLPKTEPAPEARACPEMGEGFVRLAGSDTCIKVGGSVRVETMRRSGGGTTSGER